MLSVIASARLLRLLGNPRLFTISRLAFHFLLPFLLLLRWLRWRWWPRIIVGIDRMPCTPDGIAQGASVYVERIANLLGWINHCASHLDQPRVNRVP